MSSRREQILAKMVALLEAGNIGAPVERSRTTAISRQQSPRVIVLPGADVASQSFIPYLHWSLTTHVVVYVRAPQPDVVADPMITAIHAALMTDETLGGLAMSILPASVHFEMLDTDQPACIATCTFTVTYRTTQQDLTQ